MPELLNEIKMEASETANRTSFESIESLSLSLNRFISSGEAEKIVKLRVEKFLNWCIRATTHEDHR